MTETADDIAAQMEARAHGEMTDDWRHEIRLLAEKIEAGRRLLAAAESMTEVKDNNLAIGGDMHRIAA